MPLTDEEKRERHNAYHKAWRDRKRQERLDAGYVPPQRLPEEEVKRRRADRRRTWRHQKAMRERVAAGLSATPACLNSPRPPVAYESPFPVVAGKRRTTTECEAALLGYLVVAPEPVGKSTAGRDTGMRGRQFYEAVDALAGRGFAAKTPYGAVATPLGESALPQLVDAAREDRIASLCHSMLTDKRRWRRRGKGAFIRKDDRYHVLDIGRCQHCGWTVENGARLEVDHIMPVAKGGSSDRENLQALCSDCNQGKSDFYVDPI